MRSWLTLPVVIAGLAVLTALIVIGVTLRSSPSAPALALASVPAPASISQSHVSAAAGKDLQEAQKALGEKQYDTALAVLDRVKGNPGKSEYDVFLMNRFYYSVYVALHNYQDAEQPLEATLNSRFLKPDDDKKLVVVATYLNYQLHDYDRAIEFGGRAIHQGTTDPRLFTVISQAYYLKGDWASAERFVENVVGNQVAAGAVPDKASLELWSSACIKLRDNVCERQAVEKLNAYYPSPQSQHLLDELRTAH
jgi:hypothetical protein